MHTADQPSNPAGGRRGEVPVAFRLGAFSLPPRNAMLHGALPCPAMVRSDAQESSSHQNRNGSHMRKLGALAAVVAFVGALIASATPAQADGIGTQCQVGAFSAEGAGEFTTEGATQFWGNVSWALHGPGNRRKNDTHIRLRATPNGGHNTGDVTYSSYDSPDNLILSYRYTVPINTFVPTNQDIYLSFETFFDVKDKDPHCVMYTQTR